MDDILPPSPEFMRLSADEQNARNLPLDQYLHYLDAFPELSSDELIFCVAMKVMSQASVSVGLRMLQTLAEGDGLVSFYARGVLESPPT